MGVFMDARFFTAVALFNQLGHITYRYALFSKFEVHLLEMAPSFFSLATINNNDNNVFIKKHPIKLHT